MALSLYEAHNVRLCFQDGGYFAKKQQFQEAISTTILLVRKLTSSKNAVKHLHEVGREVHMKPKIREWGGWPKENTQPLS
jgi:hypothetical protein